MCQSDRSYSMLYDLSGEIGSGHGNIYEIQAII